MVIHYMYSTIVITFVCRNEKSVFIQLFTLISHVTGRKAEGGQRELAFFSSLSPLPVFYLSSLTLFCSSLPLLLFLHYFHPSRFIFISLCMFTFIDTCLLFFSPTCSHSSLGCRSRLTSYRIEVSKDREWRKNDSTGEYISVFLDAYYSIITFRYYVILWQSHLL